MNEKGQLIGQLRSALASAIADYKAYEVPDLCERVGLSEGEQSEAFNSKYRYAFRRLQALRSDKVLDAARLFLEESDAFKVAELVAKIEDFDRNHVSELTRRRIIALFNGESLVTEIDQFEFVRRVWPIADMPSPFVGSGYAENNLEDEIFRHTVRNDDWTSQELLEHLGILTCSQRQFFRFLHEVTDPIAQNPERQSVLVSQINEYLRHDGFELKLKRLMSGSPVYEVAQMATGAPSDADIAAVLLTFNPDQVWARWEAARNRRSGDPEGAITLARTLLEDVCKWIIHEAKETYQDKDDLPSLYRKLAKILRLAPDDHTEQSFKQLLGSCQQIVELLGSLRSKLGDAHSAGPKRARPAGRHAELAVNLAGTMATFLVATWRARQDEAKK
ncbi:abortive infection family protein [Pelagibacterium limicola]|uniref:abortive infection family protein n=1 Tax=Pelagibacterium limicola TaxID=2791022 RepID=UPI0018AFE98E|nr:abortive infection family protein [Pelagibacterium limicola]